MIKLVNDKSKEKIKFDIFILTKKLTKELTTLYFRFYKLYEIVKKTKSLVFSNTNIGNKFQNRLNLVPLKYETNNRIRHKRKN